MFTAREASANEWAACRHAWALGHAGRPGRIFFPRASCKSLLTGGLVVGALVAALFRELRRFAGDFLEGSPTLRLEKPSKVVSDCWELCLGSIQFVMPLLRGGATIDLYSDCCRCNSELCQYSRLVAESEWAVWSAQTAFNIAPKILGHDYKDHRFSS